MVFSEVLQDLAGRLPGCLGLVVMGITGGSEVLFVNIAGEIDMEAVTTLGERFGLPGLDGMPSDESIKKQHRKSKKVAGKSTTR